LYQESIDFLYNFRLKATLISNMVLGVVPVPVRKVHQRKRRSYRRSRNVCSIRPVPVPIKKVVMKPLFSLQLYNNFNLLKEE
jgi:hypothetical protein